jgi:maleate isomerase
MPGLLANRARFGLILPSTNTAVEGEFNRMLVPGVSWHSGRIFIANPDLSSSAAMETFLTALRPEMTRAVQSVVHAEVDYLVMGMSAETFWGGAAGAAEFTAFMSKLSGGLEVTTGAAACKAVMEKYGAKRIGVITPYQPVGDAQVKHFFEEVGCEVCRFGDVCETFWCRY